MFCDDEFADQISETGEPIQIIDPQTVQAAPGGPRPTVAPSGRMVLLTSGTTGIPKGVPRIPRISSGWASA